MHEHNPWGRTCGRGIPHHHGDFNRGGAKMPFGMPQHGFGAMGMRARRGDVRPAVLRLLSEQPMHGYQIIQELSARSEGAWSPSAGSVYPTLQLLADEGLIVAEHADGKKVYSLTEAGVAAVAEMADQPAPWESQAASSGSAYRDAAAQLMPAIFQLGKNGSEAQTAAAVEILNDARRKLYAILAEG